VSSLSTQDATWGKMEMWHCFSDYQVCSLFLVKYLAQLNEAFSFFQILSPFFLKNGVSPYLPMRCGFQAIKLMFLFPLYM
jgi:hypothetical protein